MGKNTEIIANMELFIAYLQRQSTVQGQNNPSFLFLFALFAFRILTASIDNRRDLLDSTHEDKKVTPAKQKVS